MKEIKENVAEIRKQFTDFSFFIKENCFIENLINLTFQNQTSFIIKALFSCVRVCIYVLCSIEALKNRIVKAQHRDSLITFFSFIYFLLFRLFMALLEI